jgi:hypothetical protein
VTRRCFQSFSDLQLQHHLLESAAESNPRSYTDEPAPPTSLGPMESTQQQELGCNSTQILAWWVSTDATFMLCSSTSISDVGLNPTVLLLYKLIIEQFSEQERHPRNHDFDHDLLLYFDRRPKLFRTLHGQSDGHGQLVDQVLNLSVYTDSCSSKLFKHL